jgi:hypothetical protein
MLRALGEQRVILVASVPPDEGRATAIRLRIPVRPSGSC